MAAPHDLPAGRTLGEFVVRAKLGEGGFGAVYLAEQPRLGREAVIKVLRTQLAGREDHAQRFLREARLLSQLDHPYAAHVYAFGDEPGGLLWIAMERVRGTALDELLRTRGAIALGRFVPLFERICDVVHTAHEQAIVHRDIKPANVMVISRAGRLLPKLLDFGIAKAGVVVGEARATPLEEDDAEGDWEDPDGDDDDDDDPPASATVSGEAKANAVSAGTATSDAAAGPTPREIIDSGATTAPAVAKASPVTADLTRAGTMMGSPPYIAPEQWRDAQTVDARTDIYALGVLAYECLAGRRPFLARTMREMARAHARDPLPPLPDGLPPMLHAVLQRATAKRPADRFPDALAFAAALRAAAGLDDDEESIPRLEGSARDAAHDDAPQPIAEALAALDSARSAHEARDALREVLAVSARFLGLVAMACRTRVGTGGPPDVPAVAERLVALRRRDLTVEEWVALARELCQPLVETPEAYPIPELIELLHGDADPFAAALEEPARGARAEVERLLPIVSRLLVALQPLWTYPLAVRRGDCVELWTGPRRARRAFAPAVAAELAEGHPVLLDVDLARPTPRPPLSLWPLAQVAAPTAGAPPELFLLAGPGRHGALLVAPPHGFERHDPELWGWCREHLLPFVGESAASGASDDDAPYAGLAPHTRARADRFFGREREIEELANRLRVSSLGAVVGPSGAGKSSFVQAGLLPALPAGWQALTLRPGPSPMGTLRGALLDAGWGTLAADGSLGELLRGHARRIGGTAVLVVDQLEELVTLCRDDAEREAFAGALADAAGSPEQPVRVVVTLRDDFLIRVESLAPLRGRLTAGLALLGTPTSAELTRILVEPARRAGYELEDGALVSEIVQAVSGLPAALPLLSFTAARLWELRDRQFRHLSRRAYEALGGVAGALAKHAEHTLADMLPEEQRLVREAFRHLVTADGTRAVLARADLISLLGGPLAGAVVEKLVAARLCTTADDDRIELTHESLITAWPRLAAWRREDQEGARLLGQLRAAARQWDERSRPRGLLWLGDALAEYRLWRRRFPGSLTATEEAFAAASDAEDRRGRRFRRALVAGSFLALVAVVVVLLRLNAQSRAAEVAARGREAAQYAEQGRQAVLAGEYAPALVYLGEALSRGVDTPAVRLLLGHAASPFRRLETQVVMQEDTITAMAISANDRWVATAGIRGSVTLLAEGPPRRLPSHSSFARAVAFSPDGRFLVSAGFDGLVRRFDLGNASSLPPLLGHPGPVSGLFFLPDGTLVSFGSDAIRWDHTVAVPLARYSLPTRLRAGGVLPGGDVVFGDAEGSVHLLDSSLGLRQRWIAEAGSPVRVMAFSRRTAMFLVATGATVRAYRAGSTQPFAVLEGQWQPIWSLALSADDRWLATGNEDRTVRLWDVGSGRLLRTLSGHHQVVGAVAFSPDGDRLASGSHDGTVRIWDTRTGILRLLLPWRGTGVATLSWTQHGSALYVGTWDGQVTRWRMQRDVDVLATEARAVGSEFDGEDKLFVATTEALEGWHIGGARPSRARVLPSGFGFPASLVHAGHVTAGVTDEGPAQVAGEAPLPGSAHAIAIGGGAEVRATGSEEGDVLVWEGKTLRRRLPHEGTASVVAFDRAGDRVLTLADDDRLRVWDWRAERLLVDVPSRAHDALFIRGDEILALDDTMVRLLDGRTGEQTRELHTDTYLYDVASNVDGTFFVTAGADGRLVVWDGAAGVPLLAFQAHDAATVSASLSPGATRAAATTEDGVVFVWPLERDNGNPTQIGHSIGCWVRLRILDGALVGASESPCGPMGRP
jgi:serine/threonine protein kinase/WD40 repeat protein